VSLVITFVVFSSFFCNSLFVYKYKQLRNSPLEELDIQAVLPIYEEFSIVMSQMRRETSVLLPTSSTSLDQQNAGW
jgi:phosphatidylinositol-bisphosphatase